jgi:hypothetical protein
MVLNKELHLIMRATWRGISRTAATILSLRGTQHGGGLPMACHLEQNVRERRPAFSQLSAFPAIASEPKRSCSNPSAVRLDLCKLR